MDGDLAYRQPAALGNEFRELYCAIVDDALLVLGGAGYQHADGAPHVREREAREAFDWFLSDRDDYPTAFVAIARALEPPLDVEAVRAEVRRRWEALKVGTPVTRTFTCASCRTDFDHHYPNGIGKPPMYCPACKDKRTTAKAATSAAKAAAPEPAPEKPTTALVPRPPRARAVARALVALPAAAPRGVDRLIADLTVERDTLTERRDEIDTVLGFLTRRYGDDA